MAADTNHHGVDELGGAGSLFVEDQRFAVVPEWVIDSELSDAAFRVYSLLLRFGNGSGCRMPSRALLARRLHRSVDSVDRAMRELVSAGVVRVEHRHDGRQFLSNRYYVRTSAPIPVQKPRSEGGRTSAARAVGGGGRSAATPGRTVAARVAARVRPNREKLTDNPPPPPLAAASNARRDRVAELLTACGIDDIEGLAERCAQARVSAGRPAARWSAPCLLAAIEFAVKVRHWPASQVASALIAIAEDPATRSPMRLAEAGPWWDVAALPGPFVDPVELAELEARLDDTNGLRPRLQAEARAALDAEGQPMTRATVMRRACEILDRRAAG